tara:strand:- start:8658 stop:8849 length:192 start_codon:yes stop_codon:yes gene_type:complete
MPPPTSANAAPPTAIMPKPSSVAPATRPAVPTVPNASLPCKLRTGLILCIKLVLAGVSESVWP